MTNRLGSIVIFSLLTGWLCFADGAVRPSLLALVPSQDRSAASQQGTGEIPVQLARSLDSRKLKQGDTVEARTTDELRMGDGTVIPRGSKVVGHVTAATARAKGDPESSLGIVFDQVALNDGRTIPLKADIQAIGPPPNLAPAAAPGANPAPMPGAPGNMGGPPNSGGLGAPPSSIPNNPFPGNQQPTPPQGNTQSSDQLTPESTGVVGLHDLQLEQNSTLTSRGKQIKLQAGSQILLRVQNQ